MYVAMGALVALFAVIAASVYYAFRPRAFLNPERFKASTLVEKETITHNTKRFRFSLHGAAVLGLPTGQHISFKYEDANGREVMRSYTPVTGNESVGYVDFVIKVYPQGKMSQHIDHLNIGDSMLMRGPKGKFQYVPNMKKAIGMVAGGTGVTPMYQIMKSILRNPADVTQVSLVFANVNENDIMLRKELDTLMREHHEQLHVYYVLDNPPVGWPGGAGRVTPDMIEEQCPPPTDDSLLLFCGPRPMTKSLESHAATLGFAKGQFHTF